MSPLAPPLSSLARALLLGAGLLALGGCLDDEAAAPQADLQEVGIYQVRSAPQALSLTLPGRASAHLVAEIRPQVGGIIQRRLFEEGQTVKAGQALYQIDAQPYEAALAQAEASVTSARATLKAAELKARRDAQLVKIDAISAEDNESAQAALLEARANLQSAQAALKTARINLGYTRIDAPISGRTATSSVTAGALVTAEQTTALTTVQQLDPIYVDFTQPSTTLLRLKRELAEGKLAPAEAQDATRISLQLEDGSAYAHDGTLTFNGVSVDESTGSVTLRALVPNPEGLLLPGMYLKATLAEGVQPDAILVPQQGVARDERGQATALVVVDGKVEQRQLSLARAVGNRWWVDKGLADGDQLIVQGAQKVRVGQQVKTLDAQLTAQNDARD
ncbi:MULTISPECIES: efflux RND transporter periplasmic adaptor subunit [unclassified Pseudomonas]|uniref:efflux RND transporter periplasmic adaptor subunit n=1 Tax=unclassified Pseudomonas TaxID=196821 RepID=UPI0002A303E4|nr:MULTISPECIES: efflux RND transporter periplasmic adaptor subunit [unclassified Pseudomonas]MBB1609375.1 efflux transporter periplasmic adaptor subunit [Pseudomonas sp. UMC76]MBB1641914.1 efflux transporter periplasmic adaptor subunit [Pseudomonas sp. UME83]NTX91800.1 efflux RND transporter periplasmic adaptor subunit [Pseudomonas sp. UMA643]NTY21025.1 efflux RND transporter periplasmic adaptor subunit [Pseudomonas sp. UMC3103]NTY25559.1 efflux RND transporter periplasmic adaptor subunit [Ps